MLNEVLIQLYERDLNKLRSEIEQYREEADLWKTGGEITNSAGNLTRHLTGNLKHFIGAVLGGSDYIRNRDSEFADRNLSRDEMLEDIDATAAVVKTTLEKLNGDDLADIYPIEVFGHPMSSGYFLVHLTTHFNYHLGQINYHRRLLSAR